jgi:circadian clock protein KaiC
VSENATSAAPERVGTGIAGLDEILHGGYVAGRTYLLSGPPGCGKTTLGWHFLTAGVRAGEAVLFVTFGEPRDELVENARYSGIDPAQVHFCDLSPTSDLFEKILRYDLFPASEVELEPTTARLIEAIESIDPRRVFIDSMTSLRYLANDAPQFRRQTLSLLRYIKQRGGCVVMTSESGHDTPDDDVRFLADGVIELTAGRTTRSLRVAKSRGSDYHAGEHTLRLGDHGAVVFPRLVPERFGAPYVPQQLSWGDVALDTLTSGGIERGSITLISGPSGVGKTTVGSQFMAAAAQRGLRSSIYTFDERAETLVGRCQSVHIPVAPLIDRGSFAVVAVDALKYSPDEFANLVRRDVEQRDTQVVMIDSVSGYRLSVGDQQLNERLHALCRYLQNVGVTVLLINELLEIAEFRISDIGITYIADNVIVLRYVEERRSSHAELARVIGVLKKRSSDFEKTWRRFEVTPAGITVGDPVASLGMLLGEAKEFLAATFG